MILTIEMSDEDTERVTRAFGTSAVPATAEQLEYTIKGWLVNGTTDWEKANAPSDHPPLDMSK